MKNFSVSHKFYFWTLIPAFFDFCVTLPLSSSAALFGQSSVLLFLALLLSGSFAFLPYRTSVLQSFATLTLWHIDPFFGICNQSVSSHMVK